MSTRLKLNVKTLALHNFSDVLFGQESRIHNGFSRMVIPRFIPLHNSDYKYFKQDYIKRNSAVYIAKIAPPQTLNKISLQRIYSKIPLTEKWLDTVQLGPTCDPGYGHPWISPYSFYYDQKNPQCPPPAPKVKSDDGKKKCGGEPQPPPKGDPCGKKPKPKPDPCCRKKYSFTIPYNFYRFFSSKSCGAKRNKVKPCKPKCGQPKSSCGKPKKAKPCRPKKQKAKPCRPKSPCKPKKCKPKCTPCKPCKPKCQPAPKKCEPKGLGCKKGDNPKKRKARPCRPKKSTPCKPRKARPCRPKPRCTKPRCECGKPKTCEPKISRADQKKLCRNIQRVHRASYTKMSACGLFYVDICQPLRLVALLTHYTVVMLQFAFL